MKNDREHGTSRGGFSPVASVANFRPGWPAWGVFEGGLMRISRFGLVSFCALTFAGFGGCGGSTHTSSEDGGLDLGNGGGNGSPSSGGNGVQGTSAACGGESCSGCCDVAQTCQPGDTNTACGMSGSACEDCAQAGGTCSAGACVGTSPTYGARSSSSGGSNGSSSGSAGSLFDGGFLNFFEGGFPFGLDAGGRGGATDAGRGNAVSDAGPSSEASAPPADAGSDGATSDAP
jgi:hypothetical protein